MHSHNTHPRLISRPLLIVAMFLAPAIRPQTLQAEIVDPLANGPVAKPATYTEHAPHPRPRQSVRKTNFETNAQPPAAPGAAQNLPVPPGAAAQKDPCGAAASKPLNQLEISIAQPAGEMPKNLAAGCWTEINQTTSATRCWPINCFNWEATCFYHNPLYFEEINLERYGYQCGDRCCCCTCCRECCLQPAASAAHFYGSLLALPYCMAAECPGDCVYTLGHYRPGSCNPWRRHYPPFDPVAAAATGGFWVGMAAAIP